MARRIIFTGKGALTLETFTPEAVGENQVAVRTLLTLISPGTEGIALHRRFDPGTHWDRWVQYPFHAGYAAVGEVTEVGANVADFKIGDRVVCNGNHASTIVLNATRCFPAPLEVPPEEAVWFMLAKIGAMVMPIVGNVFAQNVIVLGAGPIGQMAARWLNVAGPAQLVVIDPLAERTALIQKSIPSSVVMNASGDQEADIVVDTTGHVEAFAEALKLCRKFGRVALLGDPGSPSSQHLTSDMLRKGLTVTAAHARHENENWNSKKIARLWFQYIMENKFNLKGLNTHRFQPDDAVNAYDVATVKREGMGVIFDWSKES